MTKTNEQFLSGLAGDDLACFISIREELIAMNGNVAEEIAAELVTAKASLAEITADRDRLAALLADASAAFDAGDIAKLTAMRESALQTETEKKLAAALAKKAEAEAEIAALKP